MLFQYVNGDGEPKPITSGDVNDYIKEATGGEFTAKHFRTWSASVIAFDQLLKKAEDARITREDGGRAGRRSARQHARDQPQILRPPGTARAVKERFARPAGRAWSGRARASACRAPRSACSSSSPASASKARRKPANEARQAAGAGRGLIAAAAPAKTAAMNEIATGRQNARLVRSPIAKAADRDSSSPSVSSRSCSCCGCTGARRSSSADDAYGWKMVIARVLAKTSIAFMVLAARTSSRPTPSRPHKVARLIDIVFIIAFALQGAVWARELILGVIGRRVARRRQRRARQRHGDHPRAGQRRACSRSPAS